MRILTCDPHAEVRGLALLAFVNNLNADEIRPTLERHGIGEVDPDRWYPMQNWLNVLNDLSHQDNHSSNLVAVGLAVANQPILPPELDASAALHQVLLNWNNSYQSLHRGADVGYHHIEKVSETHYRATSTALYPDDFFYGVAYGFARRFLPPDVDFSVAFDDDTPNLDDGGENTVINIKWGT
ncbi:MAG: hypothetical protein GYB67_09700 [Chloroflexi bacterium]|nr:hypothetical protein [Chloroflexota bacterium]